MRRTMLSIALGIALACIALPQERGGGEARQETEQGDSMIWWKWANFIILGAGLGYLIAKNVPALFRKQAEEIQKSLAEAAKVKQDADAQAAAIERRLAGLQAEIDGLRQSAHAEMSAESERIRREGEHQLQRMQQQSAQEIELMTRGAKDELRRYSAALALDLAGQRVRSRMTPAAQDGLVDGFLQDLRSRVAPRASN
jgi:F-type H+-transporting ATPase subunit b